MRFSPVRGSVGISAIIPASVTGLPESIPHDLNPSPSACFCPQSTLGRCFMGSAEDRLANLRTRSHLGAAAGIAAYPLHRPGEGTLLRWLMGAPETCLVVSPSAQAVVAAARWEIKFVPSLSMRCNTTASLRASATRAFLGPARLAIASAQLFISEPLTGRVSITLAAS